ncbi:hypothetical protein Q8F55_007526 [Vanrija albida]|uniref:Pet127-domain-containing protein n=1 Tax=Vanrija albida TaxID=181172 RepID=A0ABR3PTT3_9TREE
MLALRLVHGAPALSRGMAIKAGGRLRARRAALAALAKAPKATVDKDEAKVANKDAGDIPADKIKWNAVRVASRPWKPKADKYKAEERESLWVGDTRRPRKEGDRPRRRQWKLDSDGERSAAADGEAAPAPTLDQAADSDAPEPTPAGERPILKSRRELPPHLDKKLAARKERRRERLEAARREAPRDEFLDLFRPEDDGKAAGADTAYEALDSGMLAPSDVPIRAVKAPREAPVARLARGLQRVLFSPGVHSLRDPRTGVWNFERELGEVPTPDEFAFHRLPQYITASKDDELAEMAQGDGLRFIGSTSTLTQALSQIYFTLSGGRGVDHTTLSGDFSSERKDYTAGAQLPACLNIQLLPNGRYAVDNDKSHSIDENILSDYGRILEKLLTAEKDDFARFLTTSPESAVPESERTEREAYCYSRSSSLLMRSQLDCQDDRLPGNGTFDIKTRACMPIRMDRANYKKNSDYDISNLLGYTESFEREYYDLTRSGMLKYSLQARIGQMDGIFVAYHNTVRCFGFQYLPLSELDERLFGSTEIANQVFHLCVGMLERILEQATKVFPDRSLSMTIQRTKPPPTQHDFENELIVTFQPTTWDDADTPVPIRALRIKLKSELDGTLIEGGALELSVDRIVRKEQKLKLQWEMAMTPDNADGVATATTLRDKAVATVRAMNSLSVPDGETPFGMLQASRAKAAASVEADPTGPAAATVRWVAPNERTVALRQQAQDSGKAYRKRQESWSEAKDGMWWGAESQRPGAEVSK